MKYIIIAIVILALLAVGCGKKKLSEAQAEKGADQTVDKGRMKAVHLADSLYLILEKGKKNENHLIELDTLDVQVPDRAVIDFEISDRTQEVPAKAKAENIEILDNESVKKLKITFEAAYAIKDFLGDKAAFVDVRTPDEYSAGHAKGAELIPLDEIEGRAADRFHKDDIITLYCRSGNRSGTAQAVLESKGYFVLDIGGIGDYKGEVER